MEDATGRETGRSGSGRLSLAGKLAILGGSGLLFAGAVVGLAGLAGAQQTGDEPAVETGGSRGRGGIGIDRTVDVEVGAGEGGFSVDVALSPEDEAVIAEFEQCLTDKGVDEREMHERAAADELTEEDLDAIDAALEACEPILDEAGGWLFGFGLGERPSFGFDDFGFGFDDFERDPEDEALFDELERCLTEHGLDHDTEDGELDEHAIDDAFEACDPILGELGEDAAWFIDICEDADDPEHDGGSRGSHSKSADGSETTDA